MSKTTLASRFARAGSLTNLLFASRSARDCTLTSRAYAFHSVYVLKLKQTTLASRFVPGVSETISSRSSISSYQLVYDKYEKIEKRGARKQPVEEL